MRAKGGRGGRNGEFALAAALAIDGHDIHLLAADTDGIDGWKTMQARLPTAPPSNACGPRASIPAACLTATTAIRASAIGDLFETGPTGTNVNDFRAIWFAKSRWKVFSD